MNHLLVHTNRDIKRRLSSNKDLTVHTTEYWSKRNPTIKPWRALPQSFYLSKLQVNTVTDIQVRRQNVFMEFKELWFVALVVNLINLAHT